MTVLLWNMFFFAVESRYSPQNCDEARTCLDHKVTFNIQAKPQPALQYGHEKTPWCGSSFKLESASKSAKKVFDINLVEHHWANKADHERFTDRLQSNLDEFELNEDEKSKEKGSSMYWCAFPKPGVVGIRTPRSVRDKDIFPSYTGFYDYSTTIETDNKKEEEPIENFFNNRTLVIPHYVALTYEQTINGKTEIKARFKHLDCKYFLKEEECNDVCKWDKEGEVQTCKSKCDEASGNDDCKSVVDSDGFRICKWDLQTEKCKHDAIKTCDDDKVGPAGWCHCGNKGKPAYDEHTDTLNLCNKLQCKSSRFGRGADSCPQNCNPYTGTLSNCKVGQRYASHVYYDARREFFPFGGEITNQALPDLIQGNEGCSGNEQAACEENVWCTWNTFQRKCIHGPPQCKYLVENKNGGVSKALATLGGSETSADDESNVVKVTVLNKIPTSEEMVKPCFCNSEHVLLDGLQYTKQSQCLMDKKVSDTAGDAYFQCYGPKQSQCYCHDFTKDKDRKPFLYIPTGDEIKKSEAKLCPKDSFCDAKWNEQTGRLEKFNGCQKKETGITRSGASFRTLTEENIIQADCPDYSNHAGMTCPTFFPELHEYTPKCNYHIHLLCRYDAKSWKHIPRTDHSYGLIEKGVLEYGKDYISVHYTATANAAQVQELTLIYGWEEFNTEVILQANEKDLQTPK